MGLVNASLGEGRGEPKGLLVPKDLDRIKAGRAAPKPGGGAGLALLIFGDPAAEGLEAGAAYCHGEGEF